jgi:hypothetical protein
MQSRRKIMVIIVAVVLSLLFLGAAALVVLGFMQFSEVETALKGSKDSLERLYSRKPFPSAENLNAERANIQTIKQELQDLQAAMSAEQIEPVEQSPTRFITQFFETKQSLWSKAGTTKVDKNFDFSFGRHMKGDMPVQQDVKRLTQQLKIVEALCHILYACKISSLNGISRQEFETGTTAGAPSRPGAARNPESELKNVVDPSAGLVPPGQLYGRWHFVLAFSARETALVNVLNNLANSSIFVVVTSMDIRGDEKLFDRKEPDLGSAKEPEGTGAVTAKDAPKDRDERVICGRDSVLNVRLELDVYQFAKPQVPESVKKPEGAKK